ncbi:c-type cytochrome [Leptolyngbya sp. 'hensonii']|uniref:c-type cytochrome n=1 Tax=Leptolyngbya sp. 'hensonii' TaxID=1922337 RepID=UPI00209B7026|nr:c-type cytochrome [Leptolyngbya sp. 'hensonii']
MFKKFVCFFLLVATLTLNFASSVSANVLTPDRVAGAKIFSANCSACHMGGNNVIMADKTLKQAALEKYLLNYGQDHLAAIQYQIKNGRNAMPAFGGRLNDDQIADVASYVEAQAQKGW